MVKFSVTTTEKKVTSQVALLAKGILGLEKINLEAVKDHECSKG